MKKLLLAVFTVFTLQSQAQCWKEVKSGFYNMAGIKDGGTLWIWGDPRFGILGYDQETAQYTPKQLGSDSDWEKVDFGFFFMLAQKEDGTIWMTGRLKEDFNFEYTPMAQIGTDSDWKSFSCGREFVLFIKNDGTLWGMGNPEDGQLGIGISEFEQFFDTPVQIGTANNWKSIAAGNKHSLAIKNDGTLWTWGKGSSWAEEDYIYEPMQVGSDTDWATIDAGMNVNAAIKTNGTLWVWGENDLGQLGIGEEVYYQNEPIQQGTSTWEYVSIGADLMHGVKTNGKLYGWGNYNEGQLGNGMYAITNEWYNFYRPTLIFSETEWRVSSSKYNFFTAFINDNVGLKTCGLSGPYLGYSPNNGNGTMVWNGSNDQIVPIPQGVTCTTAGLNDNTLAAISLYPNPTSSALTLANAECLTIESLRVTDMTGKVVFSQKGNNPQINVEKLPAGMYFLNVSATEGSQHLKFIKE